MTPLLFQCITDFQQTLKMAVSVKERDLAREAAERLTAALREVPFLAPTSIRQESTRGDSRLDFILTVRSGSINRRLVCEVKSTGQPRIAREACLNLVDCARSDQRDYPVFIAPYIGPAGAQICDQYQVGYFDLAGNSRLTFDQVYIRTGGFPNPSVEKRDLRSLYSPKAKRVLRVLLTAGRRTWRMQELANEADVSLGQVANVKKLLSDREWIEAEAEGLRLRSLDAAVLPILTGWAANYRIERSTSREYYSLKPVPKMEAELAEAGRRPEFQLAFSGFSGATRLAPTVRYQRITAYCLGNVAELAERTGLKQVSSGANVAILEPYDAGVLYGVKDVDRAPVVSPVQLYLDLSQTKGRGEEGAAAILEQVIKPIWR